MASARLVLVAVVPPDTKVLGVRLVGIQGMLTTLVRG